MAVEVNVSCFTKKNQHLIKFILFPDEICSSKPSWEDCEVKTTYKGFTFNEATGVCEALTFSGCKATGNLFKTLEDCESVCVSGDAKLGLWYDDVAALAVKFFEFRG